MTARDDYPEAAGPVLSSYVRQHTAMCDEIDLLRSVAARARVLHSLVPVFWWATPPNRATAVLEGIAAVDDALTDLNANQRGMK